MIVLLYGFLGLILLAIAELGYPADGRGGRHRHGHHHLAVRPRPLVDGPRPSVDLQVLVGSGRAVARTPARVRHPRFRRAEHEGALVRPDPRRSTQRVHLRPSPRQHADRDHSGHSRPPRARRSRGRGRPRDRSRQELGHAADDGRPARASDALFPVSHGDADGRSRQGRGLSSGRRGQRVRPLHRQRIRRALVQPLPRVLRRPLRWQRHGQPRCAGVGSGQDRLWPGGPRPIAERG